MVEDQGAGGLSAMEAPATLLHVKMVAKVAVGMGVFSALALLAVAFYLGGDQGTTYREFFDSFQFSKRNLLPALAMAGLLLIAVGSWITWVIALYSSFRIAGPLFRFARNLEMEIKQGPTPTIAIRQDDVLQEESRAQARAVEVLGAHYAELDALAQKIDAIAAAPGPDADREIAAMLGEMKRLQSNVRI